MSHKRPVVCGLSVHSRCCRRRLQRSTTPGQCFPKICKAICVRIDFRDPKTSKTSLPAYSSPIVRELQRFDCTDRRSRRGVNDRLQFLFFFWIQPRTDLPTLSMIRRERLLVNFCDTQKQANEFEIPIPSGLFPSRTGNALLQKILYRSRPSGTLCFCSSRG